jgi:GNAT superfamily N-acetyltransferase
MNEIRIQRVTGGTLDRYILDLARLRIEVFRDFPYHYDGDLEYEKEYLKTYANAEGSVIVLAFDGNRVVGASTGLPMQTETQEVKHPFIEGGYDPQRIFYFGESVLITSYRGHGLGVKFFAEREAHVYELGRFDFTCFCAVERPANHPLRPAGYVPLDDFWRKRGYVKHPELRTTFSWKDINEAEETPKTMVFWMKPCPARS